MRKTMTTASGNIHVTLDQEGVYVGIDMTTFKITPEGQVWRDGKLMTLTSAYDRCDGGCVNSERWCDCRKTTIEEFNVEKHIRLQKELVHYKGLTKEYRSKYFSTIKELKNTEKEMDTLKLFKNLIKRLLKDA